MPSVIIIVLLILIILISVFKGYQPNSWSFYFQIFAIAGIAMLLFMIIQRTVADDTGRQLTFRRCEESEEKYKSLLETSTDGTLLIVKQEIVFSNFVFLAMSGYTNKDISAMRFEDLVTGKEEQSITLEGLYEDLGETGHSRNLEAEILCKRGDKRDVVLNVSKFNMKGNEGIILNCRDISGRERIEQESEHLQNELHLMQ